MRESQHHPAWPREYALALAVTLAVAGIWAVGLNRAYFTLPDAYDYAQMGRELRMGHGFSSLQLLPVQLPFMEARGLLDRPHWPNLQRCVLPTLANAAAMLLVDDPVTASIAQSGLWYILTVPVLFLLAWRTTSPAVALLSVLFYAGDPHLFESSYTGLSESLATFLLLSVFLVALQWPSGMSKWAAVGVLCGLAYLARTNLVYLAPLAAAYALCVEEGRRKLVSATLVVLCSALVVLPWCARNYAVAGDPTFSFVSAASLAWDAAPGANFIQLHEPAEVGPMLEKHGGAIRAKIAANIADNIVSPAFWDRMLSDPGSFYLNVFKKAGFAFPFVFFFALAMFRPAADRPKTYVALKWGALLAILGGFLVAAAANHIPRYYLPYRPLVFIVALAELAAILAAVKPPRARQWVLAAALSLLAVLGVHRYAVSFSMHANPPQQGLTWPCLSAQDLDAYAALEELTAPDEIVASDMSYEVCLVTGRRSVRLPENPAELKEIEDRYLPIGHVLVGKRIDSWRNDSYKAYPEFLQSEEFRSRYDFEMKMPNGAALWKRRPTT